MNSQLHKYLSKQVINRYSVKNPDFNQIENILKNYIRDYNKKFEFYLVICKGKIHFSNFIVAVRSNRLYNHPYGFNLREFLLSKIKYYERRQHTFSHISQMNITFISDLRNMTYKHYLNQTKSILEWRLNIILAKNPELAKIFGNRPNPSSRKYEYLFNDGVILYV